MMLLPLLDLQATWTPAYVVELRTDAIDVWAPSETAATQIAEAWTTHGGPSDEFPYPGPYDPKKPTNPYPRSTRPYVRLNDRHTVAHAWYASSVAPTHRSSSFQAPSLAAWRKAVGGIAATQEPLRHAGYRVSADVRGVNLDARGYKPDWKPYRRYIVTQRTRVWYYPVATPALAQAAARKEWIDGGVYALGRRLRYAETADLTVPPNPKNSPETVRLRKSLPARKWAALDALDCEPTADPRDRMPHSIEWVQTDLPIQRPPYDDRIIDTEGVPYFADGL